MIKVNNGEVELKGTIPDLLAEFASECKGMKDAIIKNGLSEDDAKHLLQESFDLAFMSSEELEKEFKKTIMKIILKGLV